MDHVATLRLEGNRLSAAARAAGLDAPVEHCPGWTISRLLGHTGKVLQRTNLCITEGLLTPPGDELYTSMPRDEAIFDAFDEVLENLCATLATCDPTGPAWNFTGEDLVSGFWGRRMAHEVEIHRWDAQNAAGGAIDPFDDASAVDGIDELLTVLMPVLSAVKNPTLSSSFHLHCTDAPGEWLTTFIGGQPTTVREHAKGDLAVRGPASALYSWAWNRVPITTAGLDTAGDTALLEAWASVVP